MGLSYCAGVSYAKLNGFLSCCSHRRQRWLVGRAVLVFPGSGASLGPFVIWPLPACPMPGCATPGCGEGQMSCSSGRCLPLALLCDGSDDCGDGTDEQGCPCPHDSLACADGRCLPPALLCDGHPDCPDAADEEACLGGWSPLWTPVHKAPPSHKACLVSPNLPASPPPPIQAPAGKPAPVTCAQGHPKQWDYRAAFGTSASFLWLQGS